MATLYELTGQAAQLMELLEAGEIDEQTVQDTLDSMMVPEKLEDYGMVIRQLTADVRTTSAKRTSSLKNRSGRTTPLSG